MKSASSIRRTLLFRCGIGVAALLAALSLATYLIVRHSLYVELDQSLRETASILAKQIEFEDGKIILEWEEGLGTNPAISDSSLFQYWDEKHGTTTRSPALGEDDLPKFTGPAGAPGIETITIPGRIARARAIGLTAYPFVIPEEKVALHRRGETFYSASRPHTLVIARDAAPILSTLASLAVILTVGSLVTPVLGFLIIDGAIRSSLRPIHALTESFRNRSTTEIDSLIYIPGGIPAELSPLAESFETLLSRVANIRNRERDFIRHASHELRTPIAGLSAVTELALSRPRSPEESIRHLQSCAESAARLRDLVQRLSALSRIGSGHSPPESIPLSLRETLAQSLAEFAPALDSSALLTSITPVKGDFIALADPTLTRLIFRNLIDNAVSYSPRGSILSINLSASPSRCHITFANPTIGLPEKPERLFEPLFRRDSSRTDSEHLGIGLTLSREAAEAMRATLSVDIPDCETIRFTLSLPA